MSKRARELTLPVERNADRIVRCEKLRHIVCALGGFQGLLGQIGRGREGPGGCYVYTKIVRE